MLLLFSSINHTMDDQMVAPFEIYKEEGASIRPCTICCANEKITCNADVMWYLMSLTIALWTGLVIHVAISPLSILGVAPVTAVIGHCACGVNVLPVLKGEQANLAVLSRAIWDKGKGLLSYYMGTLQVLRGEVWFFFRREGGLGYMSHVGFKFYCVFMPFLLCRIAVLRSKVLATYE